MPFSFGIIHSRTHGIALTNLERAKMRSAQNKNIYILCRTRSFKKEGYRLYFLTVQCCIVNKVKFQNNLKQLTFSHLGKLLTVVSKRMKSVVVALFS